MKNYTMKNWLNSSCLTSTNQVYIERLYKKFLKNSNAVDAHWNTLFNDLSEIKKHSQNNLGVQQEQKQNTFSTIEQQKVELNASQEKVFKLIDAFRSYGYKNTTLDPLDMWTVTQSVDFLDLNFYKFTIYDLQKTFHVGSLSIFPKVMKLIDIYTILKKIYCGSIGFEYMHIDNIKEISWIQQNIESIMGEITFSHLEKKQLLNEIIQANDIEQYLAIQFPGTKRFSLEGADVLVAMLKEIIRYVATHYHTKKIILSMAHRGRLNVLINVLNKKPSDVFLEFSDNVSKRSFDISGDVKYHQGFSSNIEVEDSNINVLLLPNPSHLEIVNAVAMGFARACLDDINIKKSFSNNDPTIVLPITIHGDAAISGQGVVQEILNMSKVPAYNVGGTIRIIINNQIGFTTSKICDIRSSQHCTDIAKMIQAPIFHVNADDPEKVIFAIRTALKFRNTFKRDVLVDLVCYRRHGHNEVDEPSVTQPIMYQKINTHPNVYQIYSDYLKNKGVITNEEILNMAKLYQNFLKNEKLIFEQNFCVTQNTILSQCVMKGIDGNNNKNKNIQEQHLESNYLQKLALSVNSIPKNFQLHSRIYKIYQSRIAMAKENKLFDWGGAEILAYATLLDYGISVRLSGEDTTRGTFFHRHAIIHDQNTGNTYIPLANIHENQGNFSIWDSVLSEEATLAFEYGYSVYSSPNTLVIWEAQFGDFSNGAQIVIDQFVSSGEQKWGQKCSLVMLLPHGYEGQGPEHSSARIERYLQLCAENNMKICIPSTPAQIYHLLRYQVLHAVHKPLIIMSPKSLLRHPMVNTSIHELIHNKFEKVIGEIDDNIDSNNVERILICSGKIYYDLLEHRRQYKQHNVAIVRIEQLYPFPMQEIQKIFDIYAHVKYFVWCQEEPKNQGAWYYTKNYFYKILPRYAILNYVGRSSSASPAVGYLSLHKQQQKTLLDRALNIT